MCLVIFAHRVDSTYPLVVAANRDEFHARPTSASAFWQDHPDLLAGRDLELGGTWMGIRRDGRFAAVTNFRDPEQTAPAPLSRGELTLHFLRGAEAPDTYLGSVAERATDYAGFNLLVGDAGELWYYDNAPGDQPRRLPRGIYGLSNARLDTPWPKVELGKEKLRQVLESGAISHDALADVINDRSLSDPQALLDLDLEAQLAHLLSSQFIVSEGYGTRSTTTLWIDQHGEVNWRERSFDCRGELSGERIESFQLTTPWGQT